ncbi:hypothetical protein GT755_12500 [Herbidospora sp. NEAU-GS84]|uniref:Uncharacterized protein n=1 Tax=Herbidospora solisilvae TaxID=2696284 RepID=A0A7C9JDR0_9ACTN|nr:hypothetical protein [Herbidospora solisilvae]NAS22503.1 hypothetical protein [Herbidospora solisilvae]
MNKWSGDMLKSPEAVATLTAQIRRALTEYADYIAGIRREAEAMWEANPPEEYGSAEAGWRHRRTVAAFRDIQGFMEDAARATFQLEARYRRNYHEVPARRRAAKEARVSRRLALPQSPAQPARSSSSRPSARPAARPAADESFLDLIQKKGRSA